MSDISQQIADIEKEIRETPYHKGTELHVGKLRARLARLKDKVIESELKKSGGGGGGYAVSHEGDATVVLVGPPSAGKSTLLNRLTNAQSKVAPYAFTTTTVIPGMLKYKDAYVQLLDIPGLIEGAASGRGHGKQVLSVARTSDLLLIITDVGRINLITEMVAELEGVGVRINQEAPKVRIEKLAGGGLTIHSNIKQDFDEETVEEIAQEFGIRNAEITIKERLTLDELIDAFSGSRVYIPALFVVNKVDLASPRGPLGETGRLQISAEKGDGLDILKEKIWEKLTFVRVYLVRPDEEPSTRNTIVTFKGVSLKGVAEKIGTEFAEGKKFAKIWGPGAKFPGQEVSLETEVTEGMMVRFL